MIRKFKIDKKKLAIVVGNDLRNLAIIQIGAVIVASFIENQSITWTLLVLLLTSFAFLIGGMILSSSYTDDSNE